LRPININSTPLRTEKYLQKPLDAFSGKEEKGVSFTEVNVGQDPGLVMTKRILNLGIQTIRPLMGTPAIRRTGVAGGLLVVL